MTTTNEWTPASDPPDDDRIVFAYWVETEEHPEEIGIGKYLTWFTHLWKCNNFYNADLGSPDYWRDIERPEHEK